MLIPMTYRSSLQATANILKENLHSVLAVAAEHGDLFQRLAVHPSTNFPGRTQEGTLLQLLRKKLEPEVEALATLAREEAAKAADGNDAGNRAKKGVTSAAGLVQDAQGIGELEKVWADTRAWCLERTRRYVESEATDPYTAEERAMGVENVRTGLKRYGEEEEEDEEEGEGEEEVMEIDGMGVVTNRKDTKRGAEGEEEEEEEIPEPVALVELDRTFWFASTGETTLPAFQARP